MGGDCLNVGCVPSKALIRAARGLADVRGAPPRFGVIAPAAAPRADFAAVMERMRGSARASRRTTRRARFRDLGVDVFLGDGALRRAGRRRGRRASVCASRGRCIATGARRDGAADPGLAEAGYLTNETVFSLTALPARLAVIGGGPIGCELAQAFARLRRRGDAARGEPRAARPRGRRRRRDRVERASRATASRSCSARSCSASRAEGAGKVIRSGRGRRREHRRVSTRSSSAAGRAPNVEGLGLDAAGVRLRAAAGVAVDDRLRTTNPRIYAAGDVCSRRASSRTPPTPRRGSSSRTRSSSGASKRRAR